MDMLWGPLGIAAIIIILYILSSIKILAEYERGVIFNLGRLQAQAKGPGIAVVFAPVQRMVRIFAAAGSPRSPAAGHHHSRQRHVESQRRDFSARD